MELGVAPLKFDFVQAPPRALMDTAMSTLEFVGAVVNKTITDLGKWIAKLPLDPKCSPFL
jgi:ATP-dependent RNA helicase DHX8/PRP22